MDFKQSFNIEINGVVVKDIAEKIGSFFGDEGRQIGQIIDVLTKNITIKIEDKEDE